MRMDQVHSVHLGKTQMRKKANKKQIKVSKQQKARTKTKKNVELKQKKKQNIMKE